MAFGSKFVISSFLLSSSWVRSGLCACGLRWAILSLLREKLQAEACLRVLRILEGELTTASGLVGSRRWLEQTRRIAQFSWSHDHNQHPSFSSLATGVLAFRPFSVPSVTTNWYISLLEAAIAQPNPNRGELLQLDRRGIQPP